MTKTEVKAERGVGNGGGYRGYKRSGRQHRTTPPQDKFEGRCDALKGHTLCCSSGQQAGKVAQVLREITEYVSRSYDYVTDLQLTIQKVQAFDVFKHDHELSNNVSVHLFYFLGYFHVVTYHGTKLFTHFSPF